MSAWFKKAESLLNQVDQTAAGTLRKEDADASAKDKKMDLDESSPENDFVSTRTSTSSSATAKKVIKGLGGKPKPNQSPPASVSSLSASDRDEPPLDPTSSSLTEVVQENRLLKSEIRSLSEELQSLRNSSRKLQRQLQDSESAADKQRKQSAEEEAVLRLNLQKLKDQLSQKEEEGGSSVSKLKEKLDAATSALAESKSKCIELQEELSVVKSEKSKLEMVSNVSNETHAAFLQKLEDDREATLRELEEERSRQRSHLSDQMDRECELQTDRVEYTRALAASQRMVEEKAVQIREMQTRVLAAEGEEKNAKKNLQESQIALVAAKSEIDQLKTEVTSRREEARMAREEGEAQLQLLRLQLSELDVKCRWTERQLLAAGGAAKAKQDDEESKCQVLTDQLLKKQSTLEAILAEKAALSQRLLHATSRVAQLEKDMISVKAPLPSHYDVERAQARRAMSGMLDDSHPLAQFAPFRCLDGFGHRTALVMNRFPLARVLFLIYFILVHVWMFGFVWHLTHELDHT